MPRPIDRNRVLEFLANNVPVIDVLAPKEHEELRIAGSANIWLRELDADAVTGFNPTAPIAVYCHDDL